MGHDPADLHLARPSRPHWGSICPIHVVGNRKKRRSEAIFLGLPDALDLMVVCVEAGLGLDAAMRRVTSELANSCPVICEEFAIANFQIQMGRARRDVLRDLGIRTGVDDVRALAAVIIQAEKFGSSIASALRVQSDAMRLRRRQLAEERAAKTSVKIMLPLDLLHFPGRIRGAGRPRDHANGCFAVESSLTAGELVPRPTFASILKQGGQPSQPRWRMTMHKFPIPIAHAAPPTQPRWSPAALECDLHPGHRPCPDARRGLRRSATRSGARSWGTTLKPARRSSIHFMTGSSRPSARSATPSPRTFSACPGAQSSCSQSA